MRAGKDRKRGQRGRSKEYDALYKSAKWQRIRARQLKRYPNCQCPHCRERGLVAEVVDHIKPHFGDTRLFFSVTNLQSMAKECHDRFKQSQELGGHGFLKGCDESGKPLSKEHPWYGD